MAITFPSGRAISRRSKLFTQRRCPTTETLFVTAPSIPPRCSLPPPAVASLGRRRARTLRTVYRFLGQACGGTSRAACTITASEFASPSAVRAGVGSARPRPPAGYTSIQICAHHAVMHCAKHAPVGRCSVDIRPRRAVARRITRRSPESLLLLAPSSARTAAVHSASTRTHDLRPVARHTTERGKLFVGIHQPSWRYGRV